MVMIGCQRDRPEPVLLSRIFAWDSVCGQRQQIHRKTDGFEWSVNEVRRCGVCTAQIASQKACSLLHRLKVCASAIHTLYVMGVP